MNNLGQALKQYVGISEQFNQLMAGAETGLANMNGVTLYSDEQLALLERVS